MCVCDRRYSPEDIVQTNRKKTGTKRSFQQPLFDALRITKQIFRCVLSDFPDGIEGPVRIEVCQFHVSCLELYFLLPISIKYEIYSNVYIYIYIYKYILL